MKEDTRHSRDVVTTTSGRATFTKGHETASSTAARALVRGIALSVRIVR